MKKFLAIAVIAASFVACNDGEKKVEETTTKDTVATVVPATQDTVKVAVDTTVKVTTTTDTLKK